MKKTPDEIRKNVTETMVKAITEGTPPWRKPWSFGQNSGAPCNFTSNRRYTGINSLILMLTSAFEGYESKFWGSGNAWLKHVGAHIIREQQATWITLFNMIPKRDPLTKNIVLNSKGEEVKIPLLRVFPIFNVSQIQAPTVETLLSGGGIVGALLEQEKRKKTPTTIVELQKIAEKYLTANHILNQMETYNY